MSNLEIPLSTTSSCAEEGPKSGNHQAWPKHSTNGCDLSKIFIGKAQIRCSIACLCLTAGRRVASLSVDYEADTCAGVFASPSARAENAIVVILQRQAHNDWPLVNYKCSLTCRTPSQREANLLNRSTHNELTRVPPSIVPSCLLQDFSVQSNKRRSQTLTNQVIEGNKTHPLHFDLRPLATWSLPPQLFGAQQRCEGLNPFRCLCNKGLGPLQC